MTTPPFPRSTVSSSRGFKKYYTKFAKLHAHAGILGFGAELGGSQRWRWTEAGGSEGLIPSAHLNGACMNTYSASRWLGGLPVVANTLTKRVISSTLQRVLGDGARWFDAESFGLCEPAPRLWCCGDGLLGLIDGRSIERIVVVIPNTHRSPLPT